MKNFILLFVIFGLSLGMASCSKKVVNVSQMPTTYKTTVTNTDANGKQTKSETEITKSQSIATVNGKLIAKGASPTTDKDVESIGKANVQQKDPNNEDFKGSGISRGTVGLGDCSTSKNNASTKLTKQQLQTAGTGYWYCPVHQRYYSLVATDGRPNYGCRYCQH